MEKQLHLNLLAARPPMASGLQSGSKMRMGWVTYVLDESDQLINNDILENNFEFIFSVCYIKYTLNITPWIITVCKFAAV